MPYTVDVVIVLTTDGAHRRCLDHLHAQTVAHNVIVSDGASTDGTLETPGALPARQLLRHDDDPGYATATNRGVWRATET